MALLCRETVEQLRNDDGACAWSSYMLETGFKKVSHAVGGPPELLLKEFWRAMESRDLDENTYHLSRALGGELLGAYRSDPRWSLDWMTNPQSAAQACLLYWTIAVKPEKYTSELEQQVTILLADSVFEFGFGLKWSVWRQDDNGNRFLVQSDLSRDAAQLVARDFEARGHKQTYWIEPSRSGD